MGRLDGEHIGGKLLLLLGDTLTTLLLTLGGALAWVSVYAFGPQPDLGAVIACCVAASAASAALLAWRRGAWAALALLAAGGLACRLLWERVNEGWTLSGMGPGIWDLVDRYPAALYLLCALLALVMALTVIRARAWYLAAMLSVVPVLPAIIEGTLPMWGAMLASFSAWGAMLLTALFPRRDPGSLGRAQLLSLAGMWTLILLLVMALPMEGYTRPQWATDARSSLIRGVTAQAERLMNMDLEALENGLFAELGLDFRIPGEGGSTAVSGPATEISGTSASGGTGFRQREDLLAAGPRRYAGRTVMTVSSNQPGGGRIYLRGGSLGTYTGEAWERLETRTGAAPSLYPAGTLAGGGTAVLSIRDISFQGTYYYPYHFIDLIDGWEMADESGRLAISGGEGWTAGLFSSTERYEVGCVTGTPEDGFTPLTGRLAEEELRYRQEVLPDYLAVPDAAREALESCLTGERWQLVIESMESRLEDFGGMVELTDSMDPPERFRAVMTAASRTAELLETLALYDSATPAMEAGEDFVSHFLRQGRGYCVHFATAGALLLRLQGIPARYVSGYAVSLDSQGRGEVLDSDAHAWVEVYIGGCGWYPVEMTPGYSGGEGDVTLSEDPETTVPEVPDAEEPGDPETPEPEQPEEVPEQSEADPAAPGEELSEEEGAEEPSFVFPWRPVLGTALALGALWGGYALSFLPRRLAGENPDTNRSVINAYCRFRRAAALGGGGDEVLEELGLKAKFSQHTLTEEERRTAWERLEAVKAELLARRTGWRRLLLRLLGPLL